MSRRWSATRRGGRGFPHAGLRLRPPTSGQPPRKSCIRGVAMPISRGRSSAASWRAHLASVEMGDVLPARGTAVGEVHALSTVPIPFDPRGAVGKGWTTTRRRRPEDVPARRKPQPRACAEDPPGRWRPERPAAALAALATHLVRRRHCRSTWRGFRSGSPGVPRKPSYLVGSPGFRSSLPLVHGRERADADAVAEVRGRGLRALIETDPNGIGNAGDPVESGSHQDRVAGLLRT